MESIRTLYKIGRGPSSSHTMGPERACRIMKERYPSADKFAVVLFGSLAMTGEGHGTEEVIESTLAPVNCEIEKNTTAPTAKHPNTMDVSAYSGTELLGTVRFYSIGGGNIEIEGEGAVCENASVYPENTYSDIAAVCKSKNIRIWEYVRECEGDEVFYYLYDVWNVMKDAINRGLSVSGVLPGGIGKKTYRRVGADKGKQACFLLRIRCQRGKCRRRNNSYRAHLRSVRCFTLGASLYATNARIFGQGHR